MEPDRQRAFLERAHAAQHEWVKLADAKIPPLLAIVTALLTYLGATYFGRPDHLVSTRIVAYSAAALHFWALACLAFALTPRVRPAEGSLFFFGSIAALKREDYVTRVTHAETPALDADLARVTHAGAQIAQLKFAWVRRAVYALLVGLPFWFAALLMLRLGG